MTKYLLTSAFALAALVNISAAEASATNPGKVKIHIKKIEANCPLVVKVNGQVVATGDVLEADTTVTQTSSEVGVTTGGEMQSATLNLRPGESRSVVFHFGGKCPEGSELKSIVDNAVQNATTGYAAE